jgi:hypothetical protein
MAQSAAIHPALPTLSQPPVQTPVIQPVKMVKNGYMVKEVARYVVTARIVGAHRYHKGRETDISPVDLALGWGRMADEKILHKMSFSQDRRRLYLQSSSEPMTEDEIAASTANTHIIPANDAVEEKVASLQKDQVVTLHGALVDVTYPDGWHWDTSMTRNDMGDGACEIMYVDAVIVH